MDNLTLVLASSSPRRIKMLEQQGYAFKVIEPKCKEVACHVRGARLSAKHNSNIKALYVAKLCNDAVVLSADTVVVINGKILGKPKNKKDALKMLKMLNNKTHSVLTAYTVLLKKNKKIKIIEQKIVESKVDFGNFSDEEYIAYINTGEPMDKAGAYAIQELAAKFIKQIKGSYSNIVGLPLLEVMNSLKKAGVKTPCK